VSRIKRSQSGRIQVELGTKFGALVGLRLARLGHSSPRAAMIYQHATRDRDKLIAAALGKHLDATQGDSK